MSDSVHRPHRITLYNFFGESIHVDTFATMDDAERTYGNMCKVMKERKANGGNSNVSRIGLSTVHSETVI